MSKTPFAFIELIDELIAWVEDEIAIASIRPTMLAFGDSKWLRWTCTLDPRACAGCLNRNGMIYEPDNDFWETGKENPPLHPNCRCTLTALGAILAGTATHLRKNGADYIWLQTGSLPDYYLTKEEAKERGWRSRKGNLGDVLPGMQIGGNVFHNEEGKLPDSPGRIWYEADINYDKGRRNGHRILYSSDGLIFVTYNHYHSFYEIVGGTSW